jgi:hypothetical protein
MTQYQGKGGLSAFAVVYSPADIGRLVRLAELTTERGRLWHTARDVIEAGDDRAGAQLLRRVSRVDESILMIIRRPMSREREG